MKLTVMVIEHCEQTAVGAVQAWVLVLVSGSVTGPQLLQPADEKLALHGGLVLLTVNLICSPGSASKVPSLLGLI